jgi:hypothetical protein
MNHLKFTLFYLNKKFILFSFIFYSQKHLHKPIKMREIKCEGKYKKIKNGAIEKEFVLKCGERFDKSFK